MKVASGSFVKFVYPFLFDADTFRQREQDITNSRWKSSTRELRIWNQESFPEDELLNHVAGYLNPPGGRPATARLWVIEPNALQSESGLANGVDWQLRIPRGEIAIVLDGIQLALFRVGVGFVTVQVRSKADDFNVWLDLVHYFRFVDGQRGAGVRISKRVSKHEATPFFPEPCGGVELHPDGNGTFSDILSALLCTPNGDSSQDRWWREIYVKGQLLPFASLLVDNVQNKDINSLIYKLRNFFHSRQQIYPSQDDFRRDHPHLLPYAENQWFLFSLEGGSFVAFDAPKTQFFRETLPNHLKEQYFLLFLLALHQRFALLSISEQVTEQWLRGTERVRTQFFERIRDALLDFTARGYFVQVMQREHHHRCYKKWQDIFEVASLFEEVSHEVNEMHGSLLMRKTDRLNKLLNFLTFLIAPFSVVSALFQVNMFTHEYPFPPSWEKFAFALIVVYAFSFIVFLWRRFKK